MLDLPHADGDVRWRAAAGAQGEVFAHLPRTRPADAEAALAADGVSCTLCHQIRPERLGTPESFTGGYFVTSTRRHRQRAGAADLRSVPDRPGRTRIMRSATAFDADRGHTHPAVGAVRDVPHALHPGARTERRGGRRAARAGAVPRVAAQRLSTRARAASRATCRWSRRRRRSVGARRAAGRAVPPRVHRRQLLHAADAEPLPRRARASRRCRGSSTPRRGARSPAADRTTATVSRGRRARGPDGRLELDVAVRNLAGHKLPTAYPSRRAWLHVVVRDRTAASCSSRARSRRTGHRGNDNDADAGAVRAALRGIRSADQVQIYESVMGGSRGTRHHRPADGRALREGQPPAAARLRQDDRRRPTSPSTATPPTDADFVGGGDRVRYSSIRQRGDGPVPVEVELRYQPIGYRWAAEPPQLRRARAAPVRAVLRGDGVRCRRSWQRKAAGQCR